MGAHADTVLSRSRGRRAAIAIVVGEGLHGVDAGSIDHARDQDVRRVKESLDEKADPFIAMHISRRDPALAADPKTFKSKYGPVWHEPVCNN
jgi:hypothetical protein